jgi:hypothetical protein
VNGHPGKERFERQRFSDTRELLNTMYHSSPTEDRHSPTSSAAPECRDSVPQAAVVLHQRRRVVRVHQVSRHSSPPDGVRSACRISCTSAIRRSGSPGGPTHRSRKLSSAFPAAGPGARPPRVGGLYVHRRVPSCNCSGPSNTTTPLLTRPR